MARPSFFSRIAEIAALVVCLLVGTGYEVLAQTTQRMSDREARSITKACGRTGSRGACLGLFRGALAWLGDLVLAELQAAPAPPGQAAALVAGESPPRLILDGTFAHPYAPRFAALKSYIPVGAQTSQEACGGLPDPLRADSGGLLRLICEAERELLVQGPDRWPDERKELEDIRQLLAVCLPPAAQNPCVAP